MADSGRSTDGWTGARVRNVGGDRRDEVRLLRLVGVAICSKIRHLLDDERSLRAIDVLERLADGSADLLEMVEAAKGAVEAARACDATSAIGHAAASVAHAVAWSIFQVEGSENEFIDTVWGRPCVTFLCAIDSQICAACALTEARHPGRGRENWQLEGKALMPLFDDIFPKHASPIDRSWCSPDVVNLACSIDETGCFEGIVVLGDALEEAGCDCAEILDHCREPGLHARGCWVVDGILDQG